MNELQELNAVELAQALMKSVDELETSMSVLITADETTDIDDVIIIVSLDVFRAIEKLRHRVSPVTGCAIQ